MPNLSDVLRDLKPDPGYARGALDVLALLGLVRLEGGRAAPTGKVAGMALDALRAHLADGVIADLRWEDLDGAPPRGVDILRALEGSRLARVADPTPGRVVEAAQSIIKARQAGQDVYLMQFDHHAKRYQPIGGKRELSDPDLEAALRREFGEELALPAPPDASQMTLIPAGGVWVETTLSATYGILTRYTFYFFHVSAIRFAIPIDDDTRWLTRAEIEAGRAADGRAITSIYQQAFGLDSLDALAPADQA